MNRSISDLSNNEFDLLIIGGGITGACLAWDAVTRGLTVALIEKGDFASATSSSLSGLLHGGIRYLQQGRIDKVRESAIERVYFQKLAPHISRYVPFVVPSYNGFLKNKLVLSIGMYLYQLICIGQNKKLKDRNKMVPGWKMLSKNQLSRYIPGIELKDITGGVMFYESHMQSTERMTLAFVQSAAAKGAHIANYVSADSFIKEKNTVKGVRVNDLLTNTKYEIYASCVINAAGPWIPLLNSELSTTSVVTAFSKGAHIVTSQVTTEAAIALTTTKQNQALINRGGRHVFIIPWRGHSLIGTTYDSFHGDINTVRSTESDIQELISDINSAVGKIVLTRDQVKYSFAGIYPLIEDKINTNVYQGTGEYQIIDHAISENIEGLVTVFGAKFTTARLVAEKTLDKIQAKFRKSLQPCKTRYESLPCGDIEDIAEFQENKSTQYNKLVAQDTIEHLVTYYGVEIDKILDYVKNDSKWGKRLSQDYPVIEAQIIYAVEQEMAYHLDDVLFRRTGLGTLGHPGNEVIERCADILSNRLQWSESYRKLEIDLVLAYYQYEK